MDWWKIHLIKNNNLYIAFYYPNSKIKTVNELAYNLIVNFQQGKDIHDISKEIGISEEKINDFIRSFEKSFGEGKANENIAEDKKPSQNRVVNKIMLHVSNDCNLRCKYCYANGGNYNMPRQLMDFATADSFIQFCISQFDRVENVVFFGGEPFLNVEVMNYICNKFCSCSANGLFPMPKFGVITNGTLISSFIMDFIKQYISWITVSIDGNKAMNDRNRVFSNGSGSFEKISRFIKTIKDTNINVQYEATYTLSHYQSNYTYKDIKDFMSSEFGITGIVVYEDKLKIQYTENYWNGIKKSVLLDNNFDELSDDFWRGLWLIVNDKENGLCPVIEKNFAVNANGEIYACHILNGNVDNSLGNVLGENIFNAQNKYRKFLDSIRFSESEKCKKCWAQKLCSGCIVNRFYNQSNKAFSIEPNESYCSNTYYYLDKLISLIALIRSNNATWEKMKDYMKVKGVI